MNVTWYVARASGLLAFTLLTIAVCIGLLLSGRARSTRWPRFALEDVHGFAGLLAGSFVVVHGAALLLDSYVPFSLSQLIVPGTAPYRPLATALGIVAAELLLALAVTNRYRRKIPHRVWRGAHYLNFAVWGLVLVHGLTAGTDARTLWTGLLYTVCASAVAGLTVWRVIEPAIPARRALTDSPPSS